MECFSCEKLYGRAWGLYYVRQYSCPPLLGLVSADGGDHGDHGAQHGTVLAEPLAAQPDTSNYYSQQAYTDTFAPTGSEGFYDPYASNFLTQEQDRTDTGLLGGLTIGVLVTVFLAALLGSIVAPALTAAVTRCQRIGCCCKLIIFNRYKYSMRRKYCPKQILLADFCLTETAELC